MFNVVDWYYDILILNSDMIINT